MTKKTKRSSRPSRGPGRPPTNAKRDTRQEILQAAERMFSSSGYEATSLRQIASAANVDIATVKYHYTDKAELFAEVYRRGHTELVARLGPEFARLTQVTQSDELKDLFRDFVAIGLDFIHDETDFVRLALYQILETSEEIEHIEAEIEEGTIELIEEAFSALQARGLVRPVEIRMFIVLIMTGLPMWEVSASTNRHLLGPDLEDIDEVREQAEAFVVDLVCRLLIVEDT